MSTGDELRLGKFGNQGQVNTDSLKGGVKREAAEKAGFGNIFDAFDDGNGVLTDNEISTLKQGITDAAKHGKDSIFSQNEAEEYIQQFNQNAQANNQKELKDVNAEKLFKFLQFVEQQTQSVMSSTVDSNNNAVTKYKNEQGQDVTEIIHQDTKTTEQVVVANGKEIRTFLNAEGKKEKEIETNPQTGAVMTTIYGSDGKTIRSKIVEEKSGKKTITEYQKADGEEEAKPVKATIISGSTVEEQTIVNGELKTTHKIENKGKSNQKDTIIEYNENGRIETVKENGETYKVEYVGSNRVITKKNGITQDVTTENGKKKEVITTANSKDTTTNIYNLNDRRLSQTKVIKGKEYTVTYDGNGNTTGIVVQYGENAEKIANKFGITKEALLKANGKNEGEDFNAGDVIIIPKEIEADDKNVKGRKSSADAIKDQQRADERARKREIARQRAIALDKQYRAAGLKNYEHKGEKFQYGNETYTVIGTMNNRARLMVKDSKGKICIASHDHQILKDSYVQLTTAYDKGEKVTMRNGQKVVVLNSRGDKHGRIIGLDEHGRQVVISGGNSKTDLSDRVVLNNSYVEASDVRDVVMTRIENASDDNEKKAIISQNRSFSSENIIRCKGKNGKVWYFDIKTGKAVNLTKQEAAAITKELDEAASGWGTDEAQLVRANGAIIDPEVLAEINKYYASKGYTAGEYKSSYEAFLASEISDSEIYEANADLVNNNAILDQARRDEILLTNLTTYGGESANRIKALRAIGTRTDYDNLQSSLAQHNRANGYNSHFKGQDALQTTLYNVTGGNVVEIDAANRALIESNEDFLSHDEIVRIQAEIGAMYLEAGDVASATRSQDSEIFAAMDKLTTADGQKIDVKGKVSKADLIIAGYGEFSNEEIAKEAKRYLEMAIRSYEKVEEDFSNPYADAAYGPSATTAYEHQHAEDYAAKAFQLIKNYEVLQLVKKELGSKYDEYIAKISHETEGATDFSKLQLGVSTPSDLSQTVIDENLATLSGLRVAVSDLEKSHLDDVDAEGWKQDFVNEMRQTMFLGTTRADVANQYAMTKATISKLELAAKGQLLDANGNKIDFEDAVKQLTGKTVQELQALNQEYMEHQAYGEMGLDITVGLVTMVVPVPGLGIGKLVSVGGKLYKVAQVVNAAKNEYKLVQVAINGLEAGAKMKAVQYTMDRTNIGTSVSGNTLENRGAVEDKSDEVALYSATGVVAGGVTSTISSRVSSTLGRATVNALGFGADLTSSAYISQQFHGGNLSDYLSLTNADGSLNTANMLNTVMTGVGYGQGLRAGRYSPELPPIKPQEVTTPKLDAISKDAKPKSVHIKTEEKFTAIRDEVDAKLKTITSEADIDALKQQVDVIQNRDMRRQLEDMIEARRTEIKKPVVETPVEESIPEQVRTNVEDNYMRATGGTPEHPVVSSEITETFSTETQNLLLDKLPSGGSVIAHKGDYSYIIKNNNGNIEITNRIDQSELCRVAGNDGKELPLNYLENSASVRLFFDNRIEGNTFASDFETYKANIETAHKLAYGGASGENLYYMKNGQLLKMEAGREHQYSQLSNNYVEKAQDVDAIAQKYGDSYSSAGISSPKLEGISSDALPVNMYTQHKYPDAKHLDQYFQQMYRTAEEANQMIKRGINTPAEKKAFLEKLAEHYQYAANARPFEQINNSLFMNELNTMLSKAGMSTMPHGILDHAAQRLQPESFKKYFIDQYKETALKVDPHTATAASDMPVYNSRTEQITATVTNLPANISARLAKLPNTMKESFNSISDRIKNLSNNVGEYINIKNTINTTFAPVVEIKNYLLESLENTWNKVKAKVKTARTEWKNIRPEERAQVKDYVVNDFGDALKDVIDELPIPEAYKHILTDAIDGGQMVYNGSHIRSASDLADFTIDDCGDYIKNMVRDMDLDPNVKSQIIDGIDIAQQQNSQVHYAYDQAAIEPQGNLLSHFDGDDGVIDISQERILDEPEISHQDSDMYYDSNDSYLDDPYIDDGGIF